MKALLNISVLLLLFFAASSHCFADLMLSKIGSPKDCPEGLIIKATLNDGMIAFDVDVDPEQIAHAGELYKGRVKANAFLNVATSEGQTAFVNLHGAPEGKSIRYQFRISPSAAKSSDLRIGVHLYEKSGRPTFGGGHSLQIHLAGFVPQLGKKMEPR